MIFLPLMILAVVGLAILLRPWPFFLPLEESLTAIEKAEKAYEKILAVHAASDELKEPMASKTHIATKNLTFKKKHNS